MNANVTLVIVAGVLITTGTYLITERTKTRILLGVMIASNGTSVLFLVASGAVGSAPIIGRGDARRMSDPLPQAMVLTAIVITLGTIAFLVTLAYRSFQLTGDDEVQDDVADRRIRRLAQRYEASESFEEPDHDIPDEEGRLIARPDEEDPE